MDSVFDNCFGGFTEKMASWETISSLLANILGKELV